MSEEEFHKINTYLQDEKVFEDIVAILYDKHSDYYGYYYKGLLKGMVCFLWHEELDLSPLFLSVQSFVSAINKHPEATNHFDFEDSTLPDEKELKALPNRLEIIETL